MQRLGWPFKLLKRPSTWILIWPPDLPPGVTSPAWLWRLPRRLWRISPGPWSFSQTCPTSVPGTPISWFGKGTTTKLWQKHKGPFNWTRSHRPGGPVSHSRPCGPGTTIWPSERLERPVSLGPEVILPRSIQALALLLSGRAEECLELDLGPHAGIRAICLHDVGRIDRSGAIIDSLRTAIQGGGQVHAEFTNVIPAGDLAAYLAWTGSPDRAMTLDPPSLLTFPQRNRPEGSGIRTSSISFSPALRGGGRWLISRMASGLASRGNWPRRNRCWVAETRRHPGAGQGSSSGRPAEIP